MNSKLEELKDDIYPSKIYGREVLDKTAKYQKKYGFEIGKTPVTRTHNNEADAFKHAHMQASMVVEGRNAKLCLNNKKYPINQNQDGYNQYRKSCYYYLVFFCNDIFFGYFA